MGWAWSDPSLSTSSATDCRVHCSRPPSATSDGAALELMVPAGPVLSEPRPQSLRVLSVAQAHEVSVCFLLAHFAFGDGAFHMSFGVAGTNIANRSVEVGCALGGSESLCFFFGDPTRSHHLFHLLDDAFLFHL